MGTMKMIPILKRFDSLLFENVFCYYFFSALIFVFLNSLNPTVIFLTIILGKQLLKDL